MVNISSVRDACGGSWPVTLNQILARHHYSPKAAYNATKVRHLLDQLMERGELVHYPDGFPYLLGDQETPPKDRQHAQDIYSTECWHDIVSDRALRQAVLAHRTRPWRARVVRRRLIRTVAS